jgi:hypothetical protein
MDETTESGTTTGLLHVDGTTTVDGAVTYATLVLGTV